MNKLNVGDYVRTKRDGIGKIISFTHNEDDECCFIELANRRTGIKKFNIIKSSPNIIDLIEVGDYVNGKKVVDKWEEPDWFGYFIQLEGEETVPTIRKIFEKFC